MSQTELAAELDKAIAAKHAAFRELRHTNKAKLLDELCEMMAKQELPIAARLFILDQGVLSLKKLDVKDQALIDAAEDAIQLGFRIRDLKDFVNHCKEGSHYYDYVEGKVTEEPAIAKSSGQQQPELPLRHNNSSSIASGDSSSVDRRLSTDHGYSSQAESLAPKAKPRRPSQQEERPPATPFRGRICSDPASGTLPVRVGGGPLPSRSTSNRLLQLFVFPDKTKKQKQQQKQAQQNLPLNTT